MSPLPRIYLATPYSHPDPAVREARFLAVNAVAARLMGRGYKVFSPVSHCHPLAEAGELPTGWDFWAEYGKEFITWADEVYILTAPGWEESKGIRAEILLAMELGKPVRYTHPLKVDETLGWL